MTRIWMGLALGFGLSACGGTPPFGVDEEDSDTEAGTNSVYFGENNDRLTLNNITYDAATDTLTLNNIPFDDPDNEYQRLSGVAFANGFGAYESDPEPGTNELQYYAVFRRSDSGESQVAAAGTNEYVEFGYGGAGAQRLGNKPTLPTTGIYSYNGEYAAVRTTRDGAADGVTLVTGDARLRVDFDDFDIVGAAGGTISNRQVYTTDGTLVGTLDGFISLQDSTIDGDNSSIASAEATEFDGAGDPTGATGNWQGVFAGPGGAEIAGIVFVEGSGVREVGGFVAPQ